jgi:predicted transcriptional regulator
MQNQFAGAQMAESDEKSHVAQILASYLSHNTVAPADLPSVIESVKRAFGGGLEPVSSPASEGGLKVWEPAVSVKKSITPEAVTCLICGGKFKSLKRHLHSAHQLEPREYRDAFKLKSDYPLVAPAYAARRSDLAKSLGLGRKAVEKAVAKKAGTKRAPKKASAAAE